MNVWMGEGLGLLVYLQCRKFLPILLFLCVFSGCSSPPQSRPNILLISIDTLRADHLGCYGYQRATSPFMDELASRGTRFENFFVNTYATPQSHATILSSQFQETHGVGYFQLAPTAAIHKNFAAADPDVQKGPLRIPLRKPQDGFPEFTTRDVKLPVRLPLVAELLSASGYSTLAVTEGGFMSASLGFDRGFDHFYDESTSAETGVDKLIELLDKNVEKDSPVFALYHTYAVHSPFTPPEAYRGMFGGFDTTLEATGNFPAQFEKRVTTLSEDDLRFVRAMYDAGIRHADDVLRDLFSRLSDRSFSDNMMVILTSDHGEALGEHGNLMHGMPSLHDEIIKVPLIIVAGKPSTGTIDDRMASTVDIVPTMLNYAGLQTPSEVKGADLLRAPSAEPAEQFVFAQYGNRLYAVRTHNWKLVKDMGAGKIALYNIKADPGENHDVSEEHQDVVASLSGMLEMSVTDARETKFVATVPELTAKEMTKLKSLGYVHESTPPKRVEGPRIRGHVDLMAGAKSPTITRGSKVEVNGWAVNSLTGASILKVVLLSQGAIVGQITDFHPREDVAQGFNRDDFINSGWRLTTAPINLEPGKYRLDAMAIDHDGTVGMLQPLTFSVEGGAGATSTR